MNWKQTIGLVLAVGALIAVCFVVVFPALNGGEKPGPNKAIKKSEPAAVEEERSVLPKLKGVNWKAAAEKKTSEKQPVEIKPLQEKQADKISAKKSGKEKVASAVAGIGAADAGPKPLLELQEMSWYEQDGYAVVVGTVKNVSGRSLPSVQVYATFEGHDGWFITAEHSLIELNPIFPGQISPFSVTARYYPEIIGVVLDFKKFSGERIPWSKVEAEEPAEAASPEEGANGADVDDDQSAGDAVPAGQ